MAPQCSSACFFTSCLWLVWVSSATEHTEILLKTKRQQPTHIRLNSHTCTQGWLLSHCRFLYTIGVNLLVWIPSLYSENNSARTCQSAWTHMFQCWHGYKEVTHQVLDLDFLAPQGFLACRLQTLWSLFCCSSFNLSWVDVTHQGKKTTMESSWRVRVWQSPWDL